MPRPKQHGLSPFAEKRILIPMKYFLSVIVLLAGTIPSAAHAIEAAFAPHKALYDISLKSISSGSQIANISGQMYYEWREDCDAWTSKHRFNLLYEYSDEPAMRITSDFSTFESFDGETLDFISRRHQNGQLFEVVKGQATKELASFSSPENLSHALPQGTLFPMAHSKYVINALHKGEKFARATLFDGSDAEGPVEVNAFIAKPIETIAAQNIAGKSNLLDSQAHEVQLAFFPLSSEEDTPDYEMRLTLHENSVISDMDIDYGEFSVRQELIAIEPLEHACSGQE